MEHMDLRLGLCPAIKRLLALPLLLRRYHTHLAFRPQKKVPSKYRDV